MISQSLQLERLIISVQVRVYVRGGMLQSLLQALALRALDGRLLPNLPDTYTLCITVSHPEALRAVLSSSGTQELNFCLHVDNLLTLTVL